MKAILRTISILLTSTAFLMIVSCAINSNDNKPKKIRYSNRKDLSPVDLYMVEIAYKVNENWFFSKNNECNDNDNTAIVFSVLPDGEIKDLFFIEKSGCTDLNDSAYSAIKSAAPFKPFPKELKREIVEIGLRFQKEGVK